MTKMRYTEEELEEAKEFLRRRMDNELSMQRDVESLLTEYAERLLNLLFMGAGEDVINALVDELAAELLDDCEILAVDEHDKQDAILLYMLGERNGDNLEGRIRKRCRTLLAEITAVYAAGRILDIAKDKLLASVVENFKHPWDNPVITDAREMILRGLAAGDPEDFGQPHFGRGVEVSSLGALQSITTYAVADAWMWWGYEDALERGAKGYFVERGSSYPCDECQSHVGIFYPMDDEDNRPQYHRSCKCYVVYSYVERYA